MNRVLLAALLLASAQAPLGSTLVAVALPAIANGLGSDTVHATTLLVSSYLVITILFQGPGGRLSDAFGHERTLWAGIGLFAHRRPSSASSAPASGCWPWRAPSWRSAARWWCPPPWRCCACW